MADFDLTDWLCPDVIQGRQPQGPVEIDATHQLAQYLVAALDANSGIDLVTGMPMLAVSTSPLGIGPFGRGIRGNNSGLRYVAIPQTLGAEISIVLVSNAVTRTAVGNNCPGGLGSSAGSAGIFLQAGTAQDNRWLIRQTNGGTDSYRNYNNYKSASSSPVVLGLTLVDNTATNARSYWNGEDDGTAPQNLSSGSNSVFNRFAIGGIVRSTNLFAGAASDAVIGLLFNCALTPAQHKSLSDNPWQLFRPSLRNVYMMDWGGTSSPTASMSVVTESALLSSNAQVSPVATANATTDNAVVISFASVKPLAIAAITTSDSNLSSYATSGPRASLSATTDPSVFFSSASVQPFAGANLTTTSCTFTGSAQSGATASASAATDNSTIVSSASVKPLASADITTAASVFSSSVGAGATVSAAIAAESSTFISSASVKPLATAALITDSAIVISGASAKPVASAALVTSASVIMSSAGTGATAAASITTDAAWISAIAKVSPVALMQVYTDSAHASGSASSGTSIVVWPEPSQVLAGVVYGPTGVEYTGTLVPGTGATVYIEQTLSEIMDDTLVVVLQDEVIQSNILSETT